MKKMEKIKIRKVRWTKQEDEMLLSGVKRYGVRTWKKISTLVTGRDGVRSLSSNVQSIHDCKMNRKIKNRNNVESVGSIISIRASIKILGHSQRII